MSVEFPDPDIREKLKSPTLLLKLLFSLVKTYCLKNLEYVVVCIIVCMGNLYIQMLIMKSHMIHILQHVLVSDAYLQLTST